MYNVLTVRRVGTIRILVYSSNRIVFDLILARFSCPLPPPYRPPQRIVCWHVSRSPSAKPPHLNLKFALFVDDLSPSVPPVTPNLVRVSWYPKLCLCVCVFFFLGRLFLLLSILKVCVCLCECVSVCMYVYISLSPMSVSVFKARRLIICQSFACSNFLLLPPTTPVFIHWVT